MCYDRSLMQTQEETTYSFVVEDPSSQRLDRLLSQQFPDHSRTYFQYLIDTGSVLVNGKQKKKRELVHLGDEIEVQFLLTPEINLIPEAIPLDILYEDKDLIAINKPAGLVVHPAPGHWQGTFVNALLHHCQELQGTDPLRPGIVHRLDKDTSGVLLAAKHTQAHAKLVELFASRHIEKEYFAICVGTPTEGLITAPIGRHPTKRQEMWIDREKGKNAQSVITVQKQMNDLSFVHVQLLTGRTHQIRVHLKHLGTPVLGDPVYGFQKTNARYQTTRQLLHASRLSFTHPFTHVKLEITAPLPEDIMTIARGKA